MLIAVPTMVTNSVLPRDRKKNRSPTMVLYPSRSSAQNHMYGVCFAWAAMLEKDRISTL